MEPEHLLHSVLTSNRPTHLYPPPHNSSVHLTTTEMRRSGQVTDGMRSCWRALRDSILSSPTDGTDPPGMALPVTAWDRLNRLRTGVGRFRSCLYKWGMAPSSACGVGLAHRSKPLTMLSFNDQSFDLLMECMA